MKYTLKHEDGREQELSVEAGRLLGALQMLCEARGRPGEVQVATLVREIPISRSIIVQAAESRLLGEWTA